MDSDLEKYKKWQPFLLGLCTLLGLLAGLNMRQIERTDSQSLEDAASHFDQTQKIKDVISFVQSKYVDTIDPVLLTDVALESFLSNLDPYSEYIPSEFMHKYADQIQGKLRGIGINFVDIDSQIVISQVRTKSPAETAGITVGDYIYEIDNHPASRSSINLDSIQDAIENHESDSILIKWKNRNQDRVKEEKIPIQELDEHPVTDVHHPDKQILYVKLNQLSKDSYREFMNALEKSFESKQCKNLIIDLRGNSGGLIHEAAYILNQLINEHDILMFKTAGMKIKEKEFRSTGKPFFKIEKIAVLVNHETASAAELLAATLQDLDRAFIIGAPTFGKSTVLEQFSLGDGSAIRLAIGRYYTNSGRSIQKNYEHSMNIAYLGNSGKEVDSVFYSIKKKKLASHQGVIPDILISDEIVENSNGQSIVEIADKIVGKHFIEFKTLIQNNPDNITRNEKISQLIKEELSSNGIAIIEKSKMNAIEVECKYALARWFFGEDLEHRMRLLHDECLEAALRELRN